MVQVHYYYRLHFIIFNYLACIEMLLICGYYFNNKFIFVELIIVSNITNALLDTNLSGYFKNERTSKSDRKQKTKVMRVDNIKT